MAVPSPIRQPVLDKNGLITPEWDSYLRELGGGTGSTSTTVTRTVTVGGGGSVDVDDNDLLASIPLLPNAILTTNAINRISWEDHLAWGQLPEGAGVWTASPTINGSPTVTGVLTVLGALTVTTITTPSAPATDLVLKPTGNIILDPQGEAVLPGGNYSVSIGSLQRKFLTAHVAELVVDTLVASAVVSTIGGRVLVAPTTTLETNLDGGALDTVIYTKHNNMIVGDILRLEARGQVEFMVVTVAPVTVPGVGYAAQVTRDFDSTGRNNWLAGDAVVNTRQTGFGFIDLYSVGGLLTGVGPTIVGNVRTSNAHSGDWAPRWAIGNLNQLYDYTTNIYGAAFGDKDAAWLKIDPFNGVRIGYGGIVHMQIDASGNATFATGTVIISATGIALLPATTNDFLIEHAYRFTVPTADLGIGGVNTVVQQRLYALSAYYGAHVGKLCQITLQALYDPSSGGGTVNSAFIEIQARSSGVATVDVGADTTITLTAGLFFGGFITLKTGNGGSISLSASATGDMTLTANIVLLNTTTWTQASTIRSDAIFQRLGQVLYPGSVSGLGDYQGSYYLASHVSWGLYANTSFYALGNFYCDRFFATGATGVYGFQGDPDTYIVNDSSNSMRFVAGSAETMYVRANLVFPGADVMVDLGHPSFRWANSHAVNVNAVTVWCGTVSCSGTVYSSIGPCTTSDAREKKHIHNGELGPAFLHSLRPVTFERIAHTPGIRHHGFIAQEVAQLGERDQLGMVHYGKDGVASSLDLGQFIAPLVSGWQNHDRRLAMLETRWKNSR